MNKIKEAIELCDGPVAFTRKLVAVTGKPMTYVSVVKWATKGRLPRTEWTGETHYAVAIEQITEGKIKAADLLALPVAALAISDPAGPAAPEPVEAEA